MLYAPTGDLSRMDFLKLRRFNLIIAVLLAFFIVLIFYINIATDFYTLSNNNFYYPSSTYLINEAKNSFDESSLEAFLNPKNYHDSTYIYRHFNDNLRALYLLSNEYHLPVMTGRFFRHDDFSSNDRLAVVGDNHIPSLLEREGQNYIYYENQMYKVIGVLDSEYNKKLSDLLIVNLSSLSIEKLGSAEGYWVLDGDMKHVIEDLANAGVLDNLKQIQVEANNIFGSRDISRYINYVLYVFLALLLLSFSLIIKQVNKSTLKYIKITHILGFSAKSHKKGVVTEIVILNLVFLGTIFFFHALMSKGINLTTQIGSESFLTLILLIAYFSIFNYFDYMQQVWRMKNA